MTTPASQATRAVPSPAQGWVWQDHPVALAAAAIGGALALAGILYLVSLADTGDEPPIRVKNGSIELYLQGTKHAWHQETANDLKHWSISKHPARSKDQLDVTLAVKPGPGPNCSAQSLAGGKVIVTYNNGTGKAVTITLKSDGSKHTTIESTEDLTLSGGKNDRLLSYGLPGYISSIAVDSTTLCTFTEAGQLSEMVVMDYWK